MSDDLLWAVKNADLDAMESSCSKSGFDPNKELSGGRGPIHVAADYGHVDVIQYLLSKGANVNLPDKHGITPLLAAVYESHEECVQLLLEKGANKNLKAPNGSSYADCTESQKIKDLLQ